MGNAVLLFFVLPEGFASLFITAFGPDPVFRVWGILAIASAASFVAGIFLSVRRRDFRLLVLLLSFVFSFLFVTFAGLFRGKIKGELELLIVMAGTLVQMLIGAWTIYRANGARIAASLMLPLCTCFWLFTLFISAMSFEDSWL